VRVRLYMRASPSVFFPTPNWVHPLVVPTSVVIGLSLCGLPVLSIGMMIAIGVVTLLQRPRRDSFDFYLEIGLLGLTLERMFVSWRTSGQIWFGLLEGVMMWLAYRGARTLQLVSRPWFMRATWVGLLGVVGMTVFSAVQVFSAPRAWYGSNQNLTVPGPDKVRMLPPVDREAYSARYLDIQGPGRVDYSIRLRSEYPIEIRIALNHSGSTPRAESERCRLSRVWRTCRVKMQLPDPGDLQFVIGGESTWKANGPWVEAESGQFSGGFGLVALQLRTLPRFSGPIANPNLFAAGIAVVSVLLLLSRDQWIRWTCVPLGLIVIILTGSRGALMATSVGVLLFIIAENRTKWLLIVLFAVMIIAGIQSVELPVRSIQVTEGTDDRIVVWKNALTAVFSSPIYGVNDLKPWLNVHYSSKPEGESVEQIAHSHNLFLQIFAQEGLFGLSIWSVWCFLLFKRFKNNFTLSKFSLLVTIFILNTFDMFFLYAPTHVVFWVAIVSQIYRNERI
jgi:hypothetical protein